MRELAGYGGLAEITFLGQTFPLKDDGLAPLIRYARSSALEENQHAAMTAVYRLLASVITDFTAFENHALDAKAQADDITVVLHQVIEHYCARSHWPAMRLIGLIAGSIEEIDGKLLHAGGRGLAGLSAREACNLALTLYLEGRDEEDREFALEDLNYEGNPDSEALKLLRQMQAEQAADRGERERGRDLE